MGTGSRSEQRGSRPPAGTSASEAPPGAQRGEIAEQILAAARESFAGDGYAATTLQGVARTAGVDTKLVRYYYRDKRTLFEACLPGPEQLVVRVRSTIDVPLPERGEVAVRALLAAWADPGLARVLRTSLLIAAHEPAAMSRVRAVFTDGLIPAITKGIDPAEAQVRGGLITGQMIGLAFARFVFALEPATAIPDQQLVTVVGATVQRYLTGPL